uniref:Corticotropin-releasing factor-binding protein n=1 Tax=Laticauda laticaudata TaxID=8630 RepID=A0A8C5REQ2_LATLA
MGYPVTQGTRCLPSLPKPYKRDPVRKSRRGGSPREGAAPRSPHASAQRLSGHGCRIPALPARLDLLGRPRRGKQVLGGERRADVSLPPPSPTPPRSPSGPLPTPRGGGGLDSRAPLWPSLNQNRAGGDLRGHLDPTPCSSRRALYVPSPLRQEPCGDPLPRPRSELFSVFCVSKGRQDTFADGTALLFNQELKRQLAGEQIYRRALRCLDMLSIEGQFTFTADQPQMHCATFFIGESDKFISIDFDFVNIDCQAGDFLKVFDGWILKGEKFPSSLDHPLPTSERYRDFCEAGASLTTIRSSQNVAMILFGIQDAGNGFTLTIKQQPNLFPCNIISQTPSGRFTMIVPHQHRNCSFSIIYPTLIKISDLSLGHLKGFHLKKKKRQSEAAPDHTKSGNKENALPCLCSLRGKWENTSCCHLFLGGSRAETSLVTSRGSKVQVRAQHILV